MRARLEPVRDLVLRALAGAGFARSSSAGFFRRSTRFGDGEEELPEESCGGRPCAMFQKCCFNTRDDLCVE